MFAGKKSAQIREILISESAWEEMTCLFAPSLTLTENTRKLTLTEKPWGTFILASTFEDDKTAAETHYDAVWLRDSLWGYMALVSDQGNSVAAKKVLLTLWDYRLAP
ncbi:protein [Escherichia coli]|nr:protein [Escherichia coli]CAD5753550.1 protein [Escherichia coli]